MSNVNCDSEYKSTVVAFYHWHCTFAKSNTEIFEKEQSECEESSDDLFIRKIFNVKAHHDRNVFKMTFEFAIVMVQYNSNLYFMLFLKRGLRLVSKLVARKTINFLFNT